MSEPRQFVPGLDGGGIGAAGILSPKRGGPHVLVLVACQGVEVSLTLSGEAAFAFAAGLKAEAEAIHRESLEHQMREQGLVRE